MTKKNEQMKNITGEEILIEMGWFWLWNLPVSDLYKCSHCCQVWLMTVVQSCADSPHHRDTFFSWYEALLKNATQSDLAPGQHVLSSLYRELRLIGNQLWQSGKEALVLCCLFPTGGKKRKWKRNCVKTITICSAK